MSHLDDKKFRFKFVHLASLKLKKTFCSLKFCKHIKVLHSLRDNTAIEIEFARLQILKNMREKILDPFSICMRYIVCTDVDFDKWTTIGSV